MEKALKLYTYVDGVNDVPFPSADEQIEIGVFTYDAKRMGGAPSITFTARHRQCLDDAWTNEVYAIFNNEKYYLKQIPTSSYDNSDSRYRHDVELVSERIILESVYFFDVVSDDTTNDKPVSNSSNVVFFGDIREFASRLQQSLTYSHLDYTVIVDEGVTSEPKLMSFNDQFFFAVLQEVYNTFEIPYYFVGKEIHIGNYEYEVQEVFEYGVENSLLSISKENANYKVVNRCTGDGSSDNIPYYYPNQSPYGKLNILYNNALTDRATITDWSKFAAYGPSTKLEYESTTNATEKEEIATLDDFISYKVERSGFLLDQPWFTWIGKYSIKISDPTAKLFLSFGINEPTGGIVSYSIVDDNLVEIAQGWIPGEAIDLAYGSYDIYIKVPVGNRTSTPAESFARRVAFANVYCSKSTTIEGWRINDKGLVSLSNMGITLIDEPIDGDVISFEIAEGRIPVVGKLMPSLYRKTKGADRFYNAINNEYINPDDAPNTYVFSNPYIDGKPREHIVHFEDIKPTIKGMTNAAAQRMDMFVDFEYDLNDNDEVDENGNYEHPYFYAKLRKFDGEHGFNLFAHAIEGNPMTISMTSGNCGACQWTIGVDDKSNRNVVQVYEVDTTDANGVFHKAGSLKRNDNGDVLRSGVAQDIQNDTRSNEVWIALKKEESTFGTIMPKAPVFSKEGEQIEAGYRPKPCHEGQNDGDTFVILHIGLPESYILAAEDRLTEAIIKYMSENNDDKFNFSIKFSRIYLEQNTEILKRLNENSRIKVRYNNNVYTLHVSSYSYKTTESAPLPEVVVQLSDTITINSNALQNVVNDIKNANYRASYVSDTVGTKQTNNSLLLAATSADSVALGSGASAAELNHFVRKQGVETIHDVKTFEDEVVFEKGIRSSDFVKDGTIGVGWGIYKDSQGYTVAEVDKVIARHVLEINELKVNQSTFEKGAQILSSAGCVISAVEDNSSFYRCYFDNKQGSFFSGFVIGDIAHCQRFDEAYSNIVKDYRCVVVGVSASYVDLSKNDYFGNGSPSVNDAIIQFGNINDTNRQYVIIRDVIGGGYERMLSDLNSVSATGVEYYFAGRMDGDTPRWFVGNKEQFIEYKDGHLQIKADVTLGENSSLPERLDTEYLKKAFPQGNILEAYDGVSLASLIGVNDENGNLVAGLYGGGSADLNEEGYEDSDYGAMLLFGGVEGADKPTTYKTAIFENGYIVSKRFQTGKDGKRVEIFNNELLVYGDDEDKSVLSISYDSNGKPRLQYSDKNGNVSWYLTDDGLDNTYSIEETDENFISKVIPQNIDVAHNFLRGFAIAGIPFRKTANGQLFIDANVVFGGGVTMYGTDTTPAPSLFDGLPIDGRTIKRDGNGALYVDETALSISGGGGGVVDSVAWANVYGKPTWITNTKPTYNYSEIQGTPDLSGYALADAIPTNNNQLTNGAGYITSSALDGYAKESWVNSALGNYVPSKGIVKADSLKGNWLGYTYTDEGYGGKYAGGVISAGLATYGFQLNANNSGTRIALRSNNNGTWSDWSIIAMRSDIPSLDGYATETWVNTALSEYLPKDGNAASATKLATPRTIWGQSFDGTGNVDGPLIASSDLTAPNWISDTVQIRAHANGTSYYLGLGATSTGYAVIQGGNSGVGAIPLLLNPSVSNAGKVVVGGTEAVEKLTVNGNIALTAANYNPYILIKDDASRNWYIQYYQGYLQLGNGSSKSVKIDENGYVSLPNTGTTSAFSNAQLKFGTTARLSALSNGKLFFYGDSFTFRPASTTAASSIGMVLDASGNLTVSGGITMYSQRSLKNILSYDGLTLEQLAKIKPIKFTWKDNRDNRYHVGGVADDVATVVPEVVYSANDFLTMDYGNAGFYVAASLIKPVVDHEQRIKTLECRVKELEQENKQLKQAS